MLVSLTLAFALPALAQFTQQGPKLVGAGGLSSQQGFSVSLSADGNTAIVGGPSDNDFIGGAWIWTRSAGVWTQQSGKLVGSGAVVDANQGGSVAISADGNTALVGGVADDSSQGAVWVWTRTAGVWTQQGEKLVGSGAVGPAEQGSVALSADGNTAMIGGQSDNNFVGAAWVFTRDGGIWTQQGTKLVGSGAAVFQGSSVSLSSDGNTAIIGGLAHLQPSTAWIWTRTGALWTQQGAPLIGSDAVDLSSQGPRISLGRRQYSRRRWVRRQ
jgi:hypothetical protein